MRSIGKVFALIRRKKAFGSTFGCRFSALQNYLTYATQWVGSTKTKDAKRVSVTKQEPTEARFVIKTSLLFGNKTVQPKVKSPS